ncbi:MAG: hypothetical protein IPG17_30705 [Sandaracinaceae bacterium]|nr:hypothetical protein [Sandaracinaceae bacterium]
MSNDKKTPMTPAMRRGVRARRPHQDQRGFKERAQSGVAQNVNQGKVPPKGKK